MSDIASLAMFLIVLKKCDYVPSDQRRAFNDNGVAVKRVAYSPLFALQ